MVVLHSYSWYEQCDVFQSVHCMVLNFLQIALLSHILTRLAVCVDLGSASPLKRFLNYEDLGKVSLLNERLVET